MRTYAIYDVHYGFIGLAELDMEEVRALEQDRDLVVKVYQK
jgi:hypothetical protein